MAIKNTHLAGDAINAADMNDTVTGLSGFATHQQASPDLTLEVEPGVADIQGTIVKFDGGTSPSFTAPASDPRIDLLVIDNTGTLSRVVGAEAASPVAPDFPADKFVIVEVTNAVGQTTVLNADDASNGFISRNVRSGIVLKTFFGGDGSDGALSISSGTTNIDLLGAALVTKNFSSISITGTGKLTFSNANVNGTIVQLKSQGDVTLTSSTVPQIDASGLGGDGGIGVTDQTGLTGKKGQSVAPAIKGGTGGTKGLGGIGGLGGESPGVGVVVISSTLILACGAGGGAGGGGGGGGNSGTGAAGGKGGGALYIECGGAYTASGTVTAAGDPGGAGGNDSGDGGGGGGGMFIVIADSITSDTATYTVSGGVGGTGSFDEAGGGGGGGASIANDGTDGGAAAADGGPGGDGLTSRTVRSEF